VVFELIVSSNVPNFVFLLHDFVFTQGDWHAKSVQLKVALVAVVPVQELDCVDHFALDILATNDEESNVSFLLVQAARCVVAGSV
jgi:hypothetical protein